MPEKPNETGVEIMQAVKKMDEHLQNYLTDAGILPADKSLDDGCYKQALIKHQEAGMIAADAEKKARSECTDDAPDPGEKARSVGGCVGASIDRHIANGIPINRAYMLAEEECIGARKEFEFSADPNWLDAPVEQAVTDRIWQRVKAKLGWEDKPAEATSFKVAGNHWLATYSNNFKDRDGEIFPQKAIDAYVARVDNGIVPQPELWVWHAGKAVAIGAADMVSTHGHFTLAAGQFYGGAAAQAAKAYYTKHAKDTSISHGFTFPPDQFDGKQYHEFNTFEISLLPRGVEANLYTSLEGVKDMALTEQKKKYLTDVFGKEHAERILANLDERGKALEDLGVEYKDFTDTELAVTDKAAADKAVSELLTEALEGSGDAVTAATEAIKAVKTLRAEVAEMQQFIQQTLNQRPRSASREEATELDKEQHKALYEKMQDGNTKFDDFWRQPVKQPLGGS